MFAIFPVQQRQQQFNFGGGRSESERIFLDSTPSQSGRRSNILTCYFAVVTGAMEIVTALSAQINIQQVQAHLWCSSNDIS